MTAQDRPGERAGVERTGPVEAIDARVRALISGVARQDVSALPRDADLVEALGVDSLQGLQILAGVEKQFGVRIPDEELVQMRTIGRIADTVARLQRGDGP